MLCLLFFFIFAVSAFANSTTVIPAGGSGKLSVGRYEIMVERPDLDLSEAPPKLTFTLKNESEFSFKVTITLEVYWNNSRQCPGKYEKTWTGTVMGGTTDVRVFDADLDKYALNANPASDPVACQATEFHATANVVGAWPSWLNQCAGALSHVRPDGSSLWQDRRWRDAWSDLIADDSSSDRGLRLQRVERLLGEPTAEVPHTDGTSIIYVAQSRSPARPNDDHDTCSLEADITDTSTALKHLSKTEENEAMKPIEAKIAAQEAADAKRKADELARRRRVAAERKKKEQEEAAALARIRAQEEAEAAAKAVKLKATCLLVYKSTIDKRTGDLTVRETEQVRACQALGYYPPE